MVGRQVLLLIGVPRRGLICPSSRWLYNQHLGCARWMASIGWPSRNALMALMRCSQRETDGLVIGVSLESDGPLLVAFSIKVDALLPESTAGRSRVDRSRRTDSSDQI